MTTTPAPTAPPNPSHRSVTQDATPDAAQAARIEAWNSVTVGVADLDLALELWQSTFGLTVSAARSGSDEDLARLWDLDPDRIQRQVLLHTPGKSEGGVHLVEFNSPGPTVRQGAEVFDLCPKNLDVYVDDLPRRVAELKARGFQFRNEDYTEVEAPNGTVFREIHLPSHDCLNVVLLQVIGDSHPFTPQGFAGVGPLITIVPDAARECDFFRQVFAMPKLTENLLDGPEIEKMVGLPPGSALDISIWGKPNEHFGQLEIIQYQGVDGTNRYPLARPGALGALHPNYRTDDLSRVSQQIQQSGWESVSTQSVDVLPGRGEVITVRSPAGLRIDIFG